MTTCVYQHAIITAKLEPLPADSRVTIIIVVNFLVSHYRRRRHFDGVNNIKSVSER